MKLAPNQDFGLETETGADSDNQEESYKAEKREITDLDIYDANLYVLSYDVKAPENPISEKEETGKHISLPVGGTNLLDGGVILEGPFGERAMPAIRFFAMLKYAIIAIVYSLAIIYCIYLGVRYSKAKDEEEHKKAKNHIAWFLIAFIGTHILIVFITLASQTLLEWEESVTVITQETETEIESETETKD